MTEQNKYLQVHVMGECWHPKLSTMITGGIQCDKCKSIGFSQSFTEGRRDFSTSTNYEALRKQLAKMGEWDNVAIHGSKLRTDKDIPLSVARNLTWRLLAIGERSDVLELIHCYAVNQGPEYWKEKRG